MYQFFTVEYYNIESGETDKRFRELGEMSKTYFGWQVLKNESCWKK